MREGRRKNVDCLFGIHQGGFQILPCFLLIKESKEIVAIVEICVILHNMLLRLALSGQLYDEEDQVDSPLNWNKIVSEFFHNVLDRYILLDKSNGTQWLRNLSWKEQVLGHDTSIHNKIEHAQRSDTIDSHILDEQSSVWLPK